jgi:hypothetical protein
MRRRDALKTIAASVVAGATGAWTGGAQSAIVGHRASTTHGRGTIMHLRPLMTVTLAVDPAQRLGSVPHGTRSIVPVTGGNFEGPRLRGKVIPGGADWLLLRSDDVLELDLRITLETDDHALIHMTFQGLRYGAPEVFAAIGRGEAVDPASYYFRTLPRFETSSERYSFLNRTMTVGVGETRPGAAVHRIDEVL